MLTKTIFFLAILFFSFSSYAAVTPAFAGSRAGISHTIHPQDPEKGNIRKRTRLQKLQLRLLQNRHVVKILKLGDEPMTAKQRKQAKWALNLGIASIVLLFVPILNILAIPAGVLAIIYGAKSVKGNSNSKGIIGIVLGGLTVLLFLIAIILIVAILANGTWI